MKLECEKYKNKSVVVITKPEGVFRQYLLNFSQVHFGKMTEKFPQTKTNKQTRQCLYGSWTHCPSLAFRYNQSHFIAAIIKATVQALLLVSNPEKKPHPPLEKVAIVFFFSVLS